MKKRIIISLISLLLVGCSATQPEPNENKNSEKEQVVDTSSEEVKDIIKEAIQDIQDETPKESIPEVDTNTDVNATISKKDYIIATFKEYGKDVDASQWILKEEGPNKTAVIIKEPRSKSKPLISKLIFKWNGSSEQAEILYIMVDNNYHYGNE